MGGAIKGIVGGLKNTLDNQWSNVKDGDIKGVAKDMFNVNEYILDPGGLVMQNKDAGLREMQAAGDIGNIGAKPAQAATAAEKAAKEKAALIAEQQSLIDIETAKQKKVADERAARLKQNQLLSGSETGISGSKLSLLG